jgi:hypothetical protein
MNLIKFSRCTGRDSRRTSSEYKLYGLSEFSRYNAVSVIVIIYYSLFLSNDSVNKSRCWVMAATNQLPPNLPGYNISPQHFYSCRRVFTGPWITENTASNSSSVVAR